MSAMWNKKVKIGDWITVVSKVGCLKISGIVLSIVSETYEIVMSDHSKRYVNPSSFDLWEIKTS